MAAIHSYLSCRGRAVYERGPQRLQPHKVITMHVAQEARQRRLALGLLPEVIDAYLRKFGRDPFEGRHGMPRQLPGFMAARETRLAMQREEAVNVVA